MAACEENIGKYFRKRQPLWHMRQAVERGKITIGFLGGSITEPIEEPWQEKRWSNKVVNWFVGAFPGLIVNVENAAKGATGSLNALFRVEHDIISRGCDLVFIEYAVNDGGPSEARGYFREGLLRKLLSADQANYDIVLTYTFDETMAEIMLKDEVPDSIAEYEQLCEHYHVSSVLMGDYGFHELNCGRLRWEEWMPDGVHPGDMGSHVYAVPVIGLLQEEAGQAETKPFVMPAPLFPKNWEHAHKLSLDSIDRSGAWRLERKYRSPTVDRMLCTASLQASLSFRFQGTGFVVIERYNEYSAAYRYKIDNNDWIEKDDVRPAWSTNAVDWIRSNIITYGLQDGEHQVTIETMRSKKNVSHGTNFELCDIGIIP
jgi:hypothetical protein